MGKPSIFSSEYKKKMKKRRRNVIIVSLIVVLIISIIAVKAANKAIDYTNIKKNIQAWIDSDTTSSQQKKKEETKEQKNTDDEQAKEENKPAEESMDIKLSSGNTAKAVYVTNEKGEKVFKALNTTDKGVSFDISPAGKQMMVTDTNAVITLYNTDGTNKVVSKDQYVSTKGIVFTKDSTLKSQPEYLWNSNPKFVSEDKIIFITNRPYFGTSVLKKYLWISDIQTGEDRTLWDMSGSNIEMGNKEEKGVKVTIDGSRVYYIDMNGNYVQ